MDTSYVRYLSAKATVDDRSLNQGVLAALRSALAKAAELAEAQGKRLQILELGAGIGTMVTRLLDWGVVTSAEFTLVDRDAASLAEAERRLGARAGAVVKRPGEIALPQGSLRLVQGDALEFVDRPENQGRFDWIVANAVLDLMDLRPALRRIWRGPRPGGLFWFTINYDGQTSLLPEAPLDTLILRLYDQSMDERVQDGLPCGDSKTGRHLLQAIPETGATLLAAGSSDWVVFAKPGAGGDVAYPNDEAYFLHHLVDTIWTSLKDHPELAGSAFQEWTDKRHEQIDRAELRYLAHQLDVLGCVP
jgi:SAM-dependent methyltransferase